MSKIFFDRLNNYFDQTIEISGFVENIRNLQWVQFLVIRDSKAKVQVTIEKSAKENKDLVEIVNNLSLESTVKITGV